MHVEIWRIGMLENIGSVLSDKCLIDPNAIIVAGVSGGPDSLCLMDVLHHAGCRIVVAHFNHKLRPEADAEARAVEAAAARLAIPFVAESADVRLHAKTEGLSLEEAARNSRYAFLFRQARQLRAQAVAVGHTADDQVETVLMHFIRGSGLNGLRGMSYRTILPSFDPSIPLIRPLLGVWRDETLAYCALHELNPQHDPSNDSPDYVRNRIRHDLIPTLQSYNPRFRQALWRTAQTLAADHALLGQRLAAEWERAVIRQTRDYVAFDSARLSEAPAGLQTHLIRLAAEHVAPGVETTYAILDRAAEFIADASCPRTDLTAGLALFREGPSLYVALAEVSLPFDAWPQMPDQTNSIEVSRPGVVNLAGGWRFVAESALPVTSAMQESVRDQNRFQIRLDAESLPQRLELRTRRRGDRFQPLGLQGHSQKLSDFFVNEKLPARARSRWPLLCSGDTVIWVPGYRPATDFRLRPATRQAIHFSLSRAA